MMRFNALFLALCTGCTTPGNGPTSYSPEPVPTSECPGAVIIYRNGTRPQPALDRDTLEHAAERCAELYPSSPCISKIVKSPGPHYSVTCGPLVHPEDYTDARLVR